MLSRGLIRANENRDRSLSAAAESTTHAESASGRTLGLASSREALRQRLQSCDRQVRDGLFIEPLEYTGDSRKTETEGLVR